MVIMRLKMRLKTNFRLIIIKMKTHMLEMCSVELFDLKNGGIDTITMSIGVLRVMLLA